MAEIKNLESAGDAKSNSSNSSKQPVLIVANDDGSVIITNASGKIKKRKGQSEEAYQEQLQQFYSEGPKINEQHWLVEAYEAARANYVDVKDTLQEADNAEKSKMLGLFDIMNKVNKNQLIHTAENQVFHRKYQKAIEVCDTLFELFELFDVVKKNKREIEEIEEIKSFSKNKLEL